MKRWLANTPSGGGNDAARVTVERALSIASTLADLGQPTTLSSEVLTAKPEEVIAYGIRLPAGYIVALLKLSIEKVMREGCETACQQLCQMCTAWQDGFGGEEQFDPLAPKLCQISDDLGVCEAIMIELVLESVCLSSVVKGSEAAGFLTSFCIAFKEHIRTHCPSERASSEHMMELMRCLDTMLCLAVTDPKQVQDLDLTTVDSTFVQGIIRYRGSTALVSHLSDAFETQPWWRSLKKAYRDSVVAETTIGPAILKVIEALSKNEHAGYTELALRLPHWVKAARISSLGMLMKALAVYVAGQVRFYEKASGSDGSDVHSACATFANHLVKMADVLQEGHGQTATALREWWETVQPASARLHNEASEASIQRLLEGPPPLGHDNTSHRCDLAKSNLSQSNLSQIFGAPQPLQRNTPT